MANQILAGAVFHAGQVIAGVDADNPPYVGPPPAYNLFRVGTEAPYTFELYNAANDSAAPTTFTSNNDTRQAENGRYLALGSRDGLVEVYDLLDLSAPPRVTNPADGDPSDVYWGFRVAMSSDNLFVSSLFGGKITVYDLSDMSIVNTITCPDAYDFRFASEIICNSTHLFVGQSTGREDPNDNMTEAGKVWVYNLSDFSVEHILYPINGEFGDHFGSTIKVSDTHLVVGAYGDDESSGHNQNIGAVYLYELSDLSGSVIKIDAPSGAQEWGRQVDITNTHLAVSTTNYNTPYSGGGIVNIYTISALSASLNPTYTMYSDQTYDGMVMKGFIDDVDQIVVKEKISQSGPNTYAERIYSLSDLSTHLSELAVGTTFLGQIPPYVAPPTPLSAKWIVVGAPFDDDGGASSGTAFVFDATDPSASPTKIMASNAGQSQQFGESTAAFGDMIVVGAVGANDNKGAVFVFDATDLSAEPTMLVASDGSVSDVFGCSVAVSDNYIVVGAKYDDPYGASSGSAYVFDANDLSAPHTKITANDGEYNDRFGGAVSVSGNSIVVGAQLEDDEGSSAGSVYVFTADNLSETPTKLTPSDLDAGHQFGTSVDTDGVTIVVGAPNADNQSGAAYVFDASNLSSSPTKLTQGSGDPTDLDDLFGKYVSVDGDYIVIGATQNNSSGSNTGCVYVFDTNNLSAPPTEISAPDSVLQAKFGHSVSVYRDVITVGVNKDDHDGLTSTGAAYVFDASNLETAPIKIVGDQDLGDCFGRSVAVG